MYSIEMTKHNTYTKEWLSDVVSSSISWGESCRKVGIKPFTGAQTHLKKRAQDFGIDFSHFLGFASNKGRKFPPRQPISVYLVKGSTIKSHTLKLRLIKEGLKEHKCERCLLKEWLGKPIPIELHHKDNDHWNNLYENLEILCPNCHAQENGSMV